MIFLAQWMPTGRIEDEGSNLFQGKEKISPCVYGLAR